MTTTSAAERPITAFAVPAARRRVARGEVKPCAEFVSAAARAEQRFFLSPNNTVYGGVRLNIVGREPNGCVEPADVDALCARIEADLLALRHVDTGQPLVSAVVRADRDHQRSAQDEFPDLFIDWAREQLPEKVWSEKTGVIEAAYDHWRTGDHRVEGLLLACGPDIRPGKAPAMNIEDIGPSLAARLGVTLDGVDGRTTSWLAGKASDLALDRIDGQQAAGSAGEFP